MRLVIGLGNPGARYAHTRHNIGAMAVDCLAERSSLSWVSAGSARFAQGTIRTIPVLLGCTIAWMNQTGPALHVLLRHHNLSLQDLIVVHDDLDVDLGRLRLKRSGGAGGHNGIDSIIEAVGTSEFSRLKIGIGRPDPEEQPADFVLSPFSNVPPSRVEKIVELAAMALECFLEYGIETAMNRFHSQMVLE